MKKIVLFLFASIFTYANINAVVSIMPQKTFVEKIGGDKVNVSVMVLPGNSPHTYEPKPSQMKEIAKADLYFKIGIEFEHAWLNKFQSMNKSMTMVDSSFGIKRIPLAEHSHAEDEHHDHGAHGDGLDPHVWLSPATVKVIAKNIYNALVTADNTNKVYYKANYEAFLNEIEATDKKINNLLLTKDDMAKFLVFHPSYGYFAKQYRLEQVAIESGGKNPKAKQIQKIIQETKKDYFEVIIVAPEFSQKTAELIAQQSGLGVVVHSPLSPYWSENMIALAKAIANKK
jgi:zinc transport system substrate-binding protein